VEERWSIHSAAAPTAVCSGIELGEEIIGDLGSRFVRVSIISVFRRRSVAKLSPRPLAFNPIWAIRLQWIPILKMALFIGPHGVENKMAPTIRSWEELNSWE
jgi:hypothetical protein